MDERDDYGDPDQRPRWLSATVLEIVALAGLFLGGLAVWCVVVRSYPWLSPD